MSRAVGILISGRGSNMASLVRAMRAPDAPAHPAIVISNRPEAGGLARAEAEGIPTAAIDDRGFDGREAFDAAVGACLREAGAEIVACAGFMRIMTPVLTGPWAGRMLNIHPSLLPAFRGLDTHARALATRVAVHGCTVHEVVEELDAGPILGQAALAVRPGESEAALDDRVLALEHRLYPEVLLAFARDPDAARAAPIAILEP